MKKSFLVFICCIAFGSLFAQNLVLEGAWKGMQAFDGNTTEGKRIATEILTGVSEIPDNPAFKNVDFDDSSWKTYNELSEFKFSNTRKSKINGTASYYWLRKKIVINKSFKQLLNSNGSISIFFKGIGKPDCYINGELVKQNSVEKDGLVEVPLKANLLKWDQTNTISLRVRYYEGSASMNNYPYIAASTASLLFSFENQIGKDKTSFIRNISEKEVAAIAKITYKDFDRKVLKEETINLSLKPGLSSVEFNYPNQKGFIKATCELNIPVYTVKKEWNRSDGIDAIIYKPHTLKIKNEVAVKFASFPFENQVIKGWLGDRMQINTAARLKNVDMDALIGGYLNQPGVHSWIGEHAGKFLDAACNSYDYQPDPELKILIDKVAQNVISGQREDGYLGTYALDKHWTSWDVWSHKYNLIGLMKYYHTSGYEPAFISCKRIGDLICKTFGTNQGQLDLIKSGTHVGMAATSILDPMVDLYQLTGDQKYLEFCKYILQAYEQPNGPKIISTLRATGRVDKVANAKAYEMLSNLVGIVKLSKVTKDKDLLNLMQTAWQDIVKNRLYITGAAGSYEVFQDDHDLPAGEDGHMGEGCITTTWMQFNYQLLSITGDVKYVDELERTAFNAATGAENPKSGCVSYFTPIMGIKPHKCEITCCLSSVPRAIAMVPEFTNGLIENKPTFLLYQAGSLKTSMNGQEVKFTTESSFPEKGNAKITVAISKPTSFSVLLRKPYWATNFVVKVNGIIIKSENQDFITVQRTWNSNDKIEINCIIPLIKLDGGSSYPNTIALQKGPQVLSVDKQLNTFDAKDIVLPVDIQLSSDAMALPKDWIGGRAFSTTIQVNGKEEKLIFVPFADAGQNGTDVTTWLKK